MFTKLEQRSWFKIEVAVLPYLAVARWSKEFQEGRDAVQDNLRTGRPQAENKTIQLLASLVVYDLLATTRDPVQHKR